MSGWQVPEAEPPFTALVTAADPVAWLEARAVDYFRELPERRTFRLEHAGERWFAKVHEGVGLRELLKNALVLRLPVFDASSERRAIAVLEAAGVATLESVAWGWQGRDPLRRRSFLVTREVDHEETLDARWGRSDLPPGERRRLLEEVAELVRRMHEAGVNHRDLYLVHLLRCRDGRLRLIDLHRAQCRARVPARWRSKDLAALAFSAAAAGELSVRDQLRFLRVYRPGPLRRTLAEHAWLWADVERRARRMQRRGARG